MSDEARQQQMTDVMQTALSHAMSSVEEGEALIPFVMSIDTAGQRNLQRFMMDDLGESAQAAFQFVRDGRGSLQVAVVAVDAYLPTQDGNRQDAIVVEGFGAGLPNSLQVGQPYQPATQGQAMQPLGRPYQLGQSENLLG